MPRLKSRGHVQPIARLPDALDLALERAALQTHAIPVRFESSQLADDASPESQDAGDEDQAHAVFALQRLQIAKLVASEGENVAK